LRHCATSWNEAGSIPDGIIEFFIWLFFPAALLQWSRLGRMSTRNIPEGKGRPERIADILIV
jgi:hypothetical protein